MIKKIYIYNNELNDRRLLFNCFIYLDILDITDVIKIEYNKCRFFIISLIFRILRYNYRIDRQL